MIHTQQEGDLLIVRGSTFAVKEQLKALGGRWNPEKRFWTLPSTSASAVASLNGPAPSRAPWICCDKCEVIDWSRKYTMCQACAVDGNAFRVRGVVFTGD